MEKNKEEKHEWRYGLQKKIVSLYQLMKTRGEVYVCNEAKILSFISIKIIP